MLRQEELTSKQALSLFKELNFPMRRTKIILNDINKWKTVNVDTEHNVQTLQTGNIGQLEGAGRSLDSFLNNFQVPPAVGRTSSPPREWGHMDCRTILTLKAQSSKALHITPYITQQSKHRRQNR